MANSRRQSSEVNAGSMADIAFLLLIFFLVVSTINEDYGIDRKLPKWCESGDCSNEFNERNVLPIKLNNNNELLVSNQIIALPDLKQKVMNFVDNNGDNTCEYCKGEQLDTSSDNPTAAVISILSSREASYDSYIKVQEELIEAYLELRTAYAKSKFDVPLSKLSKDKLKQVKEAYPFQVSEADLKQ